MKKLILLAVIPIFLMNCFGELPFSMPNNSTNTIINPTTGQELLDLQKALDSGAITQKEYDKLRMKLMQRLDAPVDSTDTN